MININEYLLCKNSPKNFAKKNTVEKPKFMCNPEDVMKWIDGFGIENWDEDHKWPEKKEAGECGWHPETTTFGNHCIWFMNQYNDFSERYVRIFTDADRSYISHGYTTKDIDLSFDEALKFIEEIINHPTEYIDPKTIKNK